MELPYDPNDKDSIIGFAKKLIGTSVKAKFEEELKTLKLSDRDKGQLGKVIEELYFEYPPNSKAVADFKEAGLELKSSGLKQLRGKEYRAKERLVLSIINYIKSVDETFDKDFLQSKNGHLLLVFYVYIKGLNQLASKIKLVGDWKYPEEDIEIIRKDWELIHKKIMDGKAHELSEGDTFYLGACTKGADANTVRKQPYSDIPAKQRAYSLKPGYLNHIIASIAPDSSEVYGKLITSPKEAKRKTIEEIVVSKFRPYYRKTIDEIVTQTKVQLNASSKSFYASLTKAILGIELNKEIEEFEKAEILVKTVRLKENNLPKEDISFPNFKYEEIVNEEWEDSDFKDILEQKFLFVFFQFENNGLVLRKVKFWNMPHADILKAKEVWEKTKEIVASGTIVKEVVGTTRYTNFPNKSFNPVSHVRPHAQTAANTYPLPIRDKLTQAEEYTKHCFWLNASYIRDEIYLK